MQFDAVRCKAAVFFSHLLHYHCYLDVQALQSFPDVEAQVMGLLGLLFLAGLWLGLGLFFVVVRWSVGAIRTSSNRSGRELLQLLRTGGSSSRHGCCRCRRRRFRCRTLRLSPCRSSPCRRCCLALQTMITLDHFWKALRFKLYSHFDALLLSWVSPLFVDDLFQQTSSLASGRSEALVVHSPYLLAKRLLVHE